MNRLKTSVTIDKKRATVTYRLTTTDELDAFVMEAVAQAQHHARQVAEIIPPLAKAIRLRLDLAVDKVEAYQTHGRQAKSCWITLKGKRYVITYNERKRAIEIRPNSILGAARCTFDNQTAVPSLNKQIAKL